MKRHSKTAFVAAFLIASASAAMASDGPLTVEDWNYLRNPSAPVPEYTVPYAGQVYAQAYGFQNRAYDTRHAHPRVFAPHQHPGSVR